MCRPPSALQHVQLISNPRDGSELDRDVTTATDNPISSQGDNLGKEFPVGYVGGICVGEGLPPVPEKLAARIRWGEFIEMCELIPEYWLAKEEDGVVKAERQQPRRVLDIFTWVQSFTIYVNVRGTHDPSLIPELMAYMYVHDCQGQPGLWWDKLGQLWHSLQKTGSSNNGDSMVKGQWNPAPHLFQWST